MLKAGVSLHSSCVERLSASVQAHGTSAFKARPANAVASILLALGCTLTSKHPISNTSVTTLAVDYSSAHRLPFLSLLAALCVNALLSISAPEF